jgi:hypothetical protein
MATKSDDLVREMDPESLNRLAEAVRAACIDVAVEAFEGASTSGLCCDGAFECAVGAIEMLDTSKLIREIG